jgi:uncharacterized protein (DUF305 family)
MMIRRVALPIVAIALLICIGTPLATGQQAVQPGAPGQASRKVESNSTITPSKPTEADVKFMQGMIMHHAQAVDMTALLRTHGRDKKLMELGRRISISQMDEMKFMKSWLAERGLPLSDPADVMGGMDMADMPGMEMPLMPGMLTPQQMKALATTHGAAFDRLFITGMIQHHTGALQMVHDLFASSAAAAQDSQLFDFANDVDNTQQAEIDIMRSLLKKEDQ